MSIITLVFMAGKIGNCNLKKLFGIEPNKSLTNIMFLSAQTVAESSVAVPIAIT